MKFQTPYKKEYVDKPTEPGEEIVERAGYRSIEKQVNELIMAGEKLRQYRLGYEFGTEDEIDPEYAGDPTRRPDYDLVDAQHASRVLNETRIKKLAEKAEKDAEIKRQDDLKQARLLLEEEAKKTQPDNPGLV